MTLDDAKFSLNTKINDLKKALRNRKIDIQSTRNSKGYQVALNGFSDEHNFRLEIMNIMYRDLKSLVDYTYIHELDEGKRKKLAMYTVMQVSFKSFKNDSAYNEVFSTLTDCQKEQLCILERTQERLRDEVILDLKREYFELDGQQSIDFTRIQWNGNRKQLAELFIELEQKKWVSFKEGERKPICSTIGQLFSINDTGKKQDLNVESFYTIFRPDPKMSPSKYSYTSRYQKVFTTLYNRCFNNISENKDH